MTRLPASVEVGGLVRATAAAGGFAMVLHKGEPDAGTVIVVGVDRDGLGTLYERLPDATIQDQERPRRWTAVRRQHSDGRGEFDEYLVRRTQQDPDLWIVELTIVEVERSILNAG